MQRLLNIESSLISKPHSYLSNVTLAKPDVILGLAAAFNADTDPKKVNLSVGAYRNDEGLPYIFNSVRRVESIISSKPILHEYLPIEGLSTFITGAKRLLFGQNSQLSKSKKVASCQTLSGTGALNLGFSFLALMNPQIVYISNPTWPNHINILDNLKLKWQQYPYYCEKSKGFRFQEMIQFLEKAVPESIVLLHSCAHNPTGVDPSHQQWKEIAKVMKKNNLIPFFDTAYQGFASGDIDIDIQAVRYFADQGFHMIASQSFAKNMGLYGERVGALHFVTPSQDIAEKVLSQLKIIIRRTYSSPPLYGALVASQILNSKLQLQNWKNQLKNVVTARIKKMRELLRRELQDLNTPGNWQHITRQIGMFSYTGLPEDVCQLLIKKYHIYLLKTGRISMTGIYSKNIKYLASSIKSAIFQCKK